MTENYRFKMRRLGMVVGHPICMGNCPVTHVTFQQPRKLFGAVSKSLGTYLLDGLTTQNTICELLRTLKSP